MAGPGSYVPNVYKAWGNIRRAINHDLPVSFVAINHAMAGTRSRVRHSRKVRK
jgi:hypothetical protein